MFQFGKLVQRLWRNFYQTIIWCPVAKIQATFGNTYLSKKPVRGPFQRCRNRPPLTRRRVRAQVRSGSSRASCSYLPVDQFQTIDIYEREGRRGSITEPDPPSAGGRKPIKWEDFRTFVQSHLTSVPTTRADILLIPHLCYLSIDCWTSLIEI